MTHNKCREKDMFRKPKVGLLLLYIKLYDDVLPKTRDDFKGFMSDVAARLEREGAGVVRAGICCVDKEFRKAVSMFEKENVDAIVTLHLAYSPSEEALPALSSTKLPVLMLDTTMDYSYGRDVDPARLMYNHGIHGVQDLASLLRRNEIPYEITAGHVEHSQVIRRAVDMVRGFTAASEFKNSRVVRVGEGFSGMGDFHVSPKVLRKVFGIKVIQAGPADLASHVAGVTEREIAAEMEENGSLYEVRLPEETHRQSVQTGLGLRRFINEQRAGAVSVNFLATEKNFPMPFLEAAKGMERGIGYAGEGDVLTAALVGALIRAYGDTTFTEIFCPDWKGDTLFLSHMGEINPAIAAQKPLLLVKDFPYTEAPDPAYLSCAIKPGPATLVNLSPGPNESFRLIVSRVEVLEDTKREDLKETVRAWIKPPVPVAEFLERYSRLGGTHHSAIVLGEHAESLGVFARAAGMEFCVVE